MKISTILDYIDNGHMALPTFQRGYVWNRDQVRGLFSSLYKRHPIGGLLVWVTESQTASYRGEGDLPPGVVKMLLDGQQRITSLYGVIRGKPPKFFDGNSHAFTNLMFHLDDEIFEFYQPIKMRDDKRWVDVSAVMKEGTAGLSNIVNKFNSKPEYINKIGLYVSRISQLLGINDIDLYIEEVTGPDKTLDIVVDIFNRVNSGGTKLSKGDLALAKICSDWSEARDIMKKKLREWENAGYNFTLEWMLRSINTTLTGEAKFQFLHNKSSEEIKNGLVKAERYIDEILNMIGGRLGLDHDRVLFGRYGIPVMVKYLHKRNEKLNEIERDKLLFWFIQAGMWGRFSSSVESFIDKDISAFEGEEDGIDKLLESLRLWHGGLRIEPGHFVGWSTGARFYPVLYMLTRIGDSKDWGTGLPLKANLLGKMNRLEVHHIFPKAQLYKRKIKKSEVNALSNYCFLTKDKNLNISDRLPEKYFPEIEASFPGALASQWIPMDKELWKIENYRDFIEERKKLLANEANKLMENLLHGDTKWISESVEVLRTDKGVLRKISDEEEEQLLMELNDWMVEQGFQEGQLSYEYADPETGEQVAIFDLAWPYGVQENLTQPVVVLLNEEDEIIALANKAGYRCFTQTDDFKKYVSDEIIENKQVENSDQLANKNEIENAEKPFNREYWENKCSANLLAIIDNLMKIVNQLDSDYRMKYNKYYIGITKEKAVKNFVSFTPNKNSITLRIKYEKNNEIQEMLDSSGIEIMPYDTQWNQYRVRVYENDIETKYEYLKAIIDKAYINTVR